MMKKKAWILIGLCAVLVGLASYARPTKRFEGQFLSVFDTVSRVIGYDSSAVAFKAKMETIEDMLYEYHKLYDIYNEYPGVNNLKTINDAAGEHPVQVDEKILDLLEYGKEAYRLTDGKVNIVFGSVLGLWHEARDAGIDDPIHAELPHRTLLEEAARHTNIDDLIIDRERGTAYLADKEMRLDVGAVAKGYAVERVADALEEQGETHLLMSIGGNIRAIGDKTNGEPWVVPVQSPYENGEDYLCKTNLIDTSVVGSGDYQRYYTVGGVKYHHIIDEETLMPADYHRAVAVICEDSGMADVLTTGLFLMDLEKGQALVESLDGVEAVWADARGNVVYSQGFQGYVQETR